MRKSIGASHMNAAVVEWDKRKVMEKKDWIAIGLLVLLAAGARLSFALRNPGGLLHFGNQETPAARTPTPVLSSGVLYFQGFQEPLSVMLAATDESREQGLSGRPNLAESEGMLFLFDNPGRPAFWMKDMRFSLDIIWISKDWSIVDITPNLTPDTYPNAFSPDSDAQYVLEVRAGFAKRHSLSVGQSVVFKK